MQKVLFKDCDVASEGMPSTRYQGSKKKLLPLLHEVFDTIDFTTCLDAFGGTGSVSHLLRRMDKKVQYNEIMPSSCMIARALFANKPMVLRLEQLDDLLARRSGVNYDNVIENTYQSIYFLDEENKQIDTFCANVQLLEDVTARAEAYYLLFQTLLCKRPYNLFHRANLYMRTKDVERSFGNKTTWERPIIKHMQKFYKELANYREYKLKYKVKVTCKSAFELRGKYDIVYIDTPYAKSKGLQESNYFSFYHFMDALLDYENISKRIISELKHKPIYEANKSWYPTKTISEAFTELFRRYSDSTLVISYRSDGHPTPSELISFLDQLYHSVTEIHLSDYKYVLSKRKTDTKEIAIVAKDPR